MKEKALNCFQGAASATGARLEYQWGDISYAPMLNNSFASSLSGIDEDVELANNTGNTVAEIIDDGSIIATYGESPLEAMAIVATVSTNGTWQYRLQESLFQSNQPLFHMDQYLGYSGYRQNGENHRSAHDLL